MDHHTIIAIVTSAVASLVFVAIIRALGLLTSFNKKTDEEEVEKWRKDQDRWDKKYPNDKHPIGKTANEFANTDFVTNPEKWNLEHPENPHP